MRILRVYVESYYVPGGIRDRIPREGDLVYYPADGEYYEIVEVLDDYLQSDCYGNYLECICREVLPDRDCIFKGLPTGRKAMYT